MHDGVGGDGQGQHRIRADAGLGDEVGQQAVHGLAHRGGQLRFAARMHHHPGHPAHQVLAEANLRIHAPGPGQHLAGGEVAEMRGQGGRADVQRHARDALLQAGPERHHPLFALHRRRDPPLALAEQRLQVRQQAEVAGEVLQPPLAGQGDEQPLLVSRGMIDVRRRHFHIAEPHHRIDLDVAGLGGLAHHLAMDLAVRRHIDHHVALESRVATEPPSAGQAAPLREALFGLA